MITANQNFIQKHPYKAGMAWGLATALLVYPIDWILAWDTQTLWLAAPIFMLGGLAWGRLMKRFFDQRSARR